jgi:hypothetical protein
MTRFVQQQFSAAVLALQNCLRAVQFKRFRAENRDFCSESGVGDYMFRTVRWIGFIACLMIVGLCFSSSQQGPAPIPPNLKIEPPDPALPVEIKSLVGKWSGSWDSRWDSLLYIEKVDKDSAQVVFSWGDYTTSHGTCHCGPNWMRVQKAAVKYSPGTAKLEFYTPKIQPRWVNETHSATGSYDEVYHAGGGSSGRYTYSFVLKMREPNTMKGDFWSAKNSPLHIKLKKIE